MIEEKTPPNMTRLMDNSLIPTEKLNTFEMPPVVQGQPVAVYKPFNINRPPYAVGLVVQAHPRQLTIYIPGGSPSRVESVKHIDDPRLMKNRDQQESGAWDYTSYDKQRAKEWEWVKNAITTLEKQVKALQAPAKKPTMGKKQTPEPVNIDGENNK